LAETRLETIDGMTPLSSEAIAASDAIHRRLKSGMALEELRDALRMTQQELAQTLNVD
jgi:DNA-binding transcriptional regulator YiaG